MFIAATTNEESFSAKQAVVALFDPINPMVDPLRGKCGARSGYHRVLWTSHVP